jgi:hypothetical protein
MRNPAALLGLWLCLPMLVLACTDSKADRRIAECKAIAENYSSVVGYQAVNYDGIRVDLRLTVKSAIKNLNGHVSCAYSPTSALPTSVTIGKTEHLNAADIQSLIDRKYLDGQGFSSHSH